MKLDPEAVRIRKEHARSTRQRVEVRRELSGNASIAGRELDTARALACKAYIDAVAVKVRNHGGLEDSLSSVRALVMTELLQGRDPLNLLRPRPAVGGPRPAEADPPRPGHPGAPDDPGPDDADYPCSPGDPDDPGPDDRDSPAEYDGPARPGYAGPGGRPGWDADDAENARYGVPDADDLPRRGPLRPGRPPPSPPPSTSSSPSAPSSAGPLPPPRPTASASWTPPRPGPSSRPPPGTPEPAGAPPSSTPTAPPPPTPAPPASTPGPHHRKQAPQAQATPPMPAS